MIQSLEGLRGLAALIVALYHLKIGVDYFPVLKQGYIFVDLFFVLSGFVICAAYFTKMNTTQDLKPFVIRRFGRLFPLLVFSTLLYLAVANFIVLAKHIAVAQGYGGVLNNPDALNYLVPTAGEIAATLTLTHSLGLFDELILNTPSWSISTEFYTYLLFAAVCLAFPAKRRLPVFGLLAAAGMAVSVWASVTVHDCLNAGGCLGVTYDYGFMRCVFSFFLGAILFHGSQSLRSGHVRLQALGMLILAVLFSLIGRFPALAFAFPFAFALLILSLAKDEGPLADLLKRKPFQVLGQRSYSIYMLHMPLMLVFENVSKRADGFLAGSLVVAAYVFILLLISGWTYRFVEDPFRIMFNELAKGKRSAGVAVKDRPLDRSPQRPHSAAASAIDIKPSAAD